VTKIVSVGGAPQTGTTVGVKVSPGRGVPWEVTTAVEVERAREGPRGRYQVVNTKYPLPASTVKITNTKLEILIWDSVNWFVRKLNSFENKFFIIFYLGLISPTSQLPHYLITWFLDKPEKQLSERMIHTVG